MTENKKIPFSFKADSSTTEKIEKYASLHKCTKSEAINALLSVETQMDVIRSTPKEASRHKEKMEDLAKMDEIDEKRFQRHMKEQAGKQNHTPESQKVEGGAGDGHHDTGYKIPKGERPEGALVADAYGFYGDFDWTPEQLAELKKKIPLQGLDLEEDEMHD